MKLRTLLCMASAMVFAACGGGGTTSSPGAAMPGSPGIPGTVTPTIQQVSGTLTIGNPGTTASSNNRGPAFVSASTKHAALFIDGAVTASGSTTTCTATAGTGAGCTITWAAQLTVPAAHIFAVETDSGSNAPLNTVLSMGAASYAVVAGNANALTPLSLNGVAGQVTYTVGACSGTTPASLCAGTITIADRAGAAIAYTGATAVPTLGNNPSSGNVFDNGAPTFVSNTPASGTITGTVQTNFSSLAAGVLTLSGVDTTGIYTYQVTCAAAAGGSFGITQAGAATPDLVVTTAELTGLATPVSYPSGVLTVNGAPSFTCTGGNITSTGGTLPVN